MTRHRFALKRMVLAAVVVCCAMVPLAGQPPGQGPGASQGPTVTSPK